MTKKAQAEMLGLVLIIAVLLIAALFYVRFSIFGAKEHREESTIRVTQASNLMNALINLPLCEEKTLKELLPQCAQTTTPFCGHPNTCIYLEQELPSIIDPILHTSLGIDYTFEAATDTPFLTFGQCTTGTNSPPLRFTEHGKHYQASFKLCKR